MVVVPGKRFQSHPSCTKPLPARDTGFPFPIICTEPYDEEKSSLVSAWDAQGKAYYDYSKYNKERLPAFAQVDLRIDKTFYLKHCMLGFYLDLQNITASKLKQQDVLMSTGIIENPEAPADSQHYKMKRLKQSSGTLLPTLGITFEY